MRATLWVIVTLFDGIPFFALLYYHYRNFKEELHEASTSENVTFLQDDDGKSAISEDEVREILETITKSEEGSDVDENEAYNKNNRISALEREPP